MHKINITIIGAGVIGLAIARELSKDYEDILIVEKNNSFGQEISSRNSEVIHAGIYYPGGSLKAKTCVEGRHLMYEYCEKNNIGYKKTGKLIVAVKDDEVKSLEELFNNGLENGVEDLKLLSKNEVKSIEPNIKAKGAIYSSSTGILDSHSLMKKLAAEAKSNNAEIAYNTEVIGIDKVSEGYKVAVKDKSEGSFSFLSRIVINSAGLDSDKIAEAAGLKNKEYQLKYCKGDYFRVHNNKAKFINKLIYPIPTENKVSLGIHATLDLAGGLRLGPDEEYVEKLNYDIDDKKREFFYNSVTDFLPFINPKDLSPDTSGIRPKLQGKGEGFRDFIIKDEIDSGFPGLINLIGIESPGLTSCLSIAKTVKTLINKTF